MQFQFAAPAAAAPLVAREEGARDASGVFKATEERAPPRVIPLPEALRNRSIPEPVAVPEKPKAKAPTQPVTFQPGLQFVGRSAAQKTVEGAPPAAAPGEMPMLMMNAVPGLAEIADERERFQKDLQSRSQDVEQSAYDDMPVEEFGKALLRGMGWKEGEGIGRSNKVDAPVIQYIPRPERLGLGAAPKKVEEPPPPSASKKRRIAKPGEEPNRKEQEYELTRTADGKVKHTVTIDEGLVVKAKLELKQGALVGIVGGVHEGLLGKVTRVALDRASVTVRLGSGEEVTVKSPEAVLLDPALLQRANGMEEVKRVMAAARQELRGAQKQDSRREEERKEKKKKKKEKKSRKVATWLVPGIVVRCVSKTFQGGRLYQKKLLITDLVTVDVASAVLLEDRSKLVEQVTKDLVETALPQVGGTVKVVRGARTGELATLQQRDSEKNRAVIQLEEDGTIETCAMDDVAQYVGLS